MNGPLVIIGDALLDVDLEGHAGRLCPDAPVPVLDNLVERTRPGGAGLAAAMGREDGIDVVLVTAVGDDESGSRLRELLDGVHVMPLRSRGASPVKRRVMADGQSLLRLDSGGEPGGVAAASQDVIDVIHSAATVLVADYGRGTVDAPGIRDALCGVALDVPVTWDPHPRGSAPVVGARLVTPNEDEARQLAIARGLVAEGPRRALQTVRRQAEALARAWRAHAVAVTLGQRGALISYGGGAPVLVPAPEVTAVDSCGAGDRLSVSAAVALGSGAIITEAVTEGVRRAAEYVAAGGPRTLLSPPATGGVAGTAGGGAADAASARRPRQETLVATGGCFDLLHAGHVASLRAARALGDRLVVCLNSDESVRRLKGDGRPLVPAADRARVLLALECVDEVVVFDEDTPVEVLRRLQPDIWTKGGDYAGADVPEAAALDEWGGQAVVLPYVEGRSTTALVKAAASGSAPRPRTSRDVTVPPAAPGNETTRSGS